MKDLYFITTDVGTPYRWNATEQRWEGMFYKSGFKGWENRSAAARLAFDPSDVTGNTLYATTGGMWSVDGTVLKSVDRGNTWSDCQIRLDVNPNKEQGAGQRIAVDPNNSGVVYVTRAVPRIQRSPRPTAPSNPPAAASRLLGKSERPLRQLCPL